MNDQKESGKTGKQVIKSYPAYWEFPNILGKTAGTTKSFIEQASSETQYHKGFQRKLVFKNNSGTAVGYMYQLNRKK